MPSTTNITIFLNEIVKGRDTEIRITSDKMIYAVDLVMLNTNKDRDQA